MQTTTNYSLLIPEGTDIVNPLTQVNPNFQTIDGAMFANKEATVGTATEVVTGTVHAVVRANTDAPMFRFTATGAWTAGDTMTLDGTSVTVHLADGTAPATGAYVIGAEVVAVVNGTLVTLLTSAAQPVAGVTSFNSRTGAVSPAASDYDGSMIDYDNTLSGLNATDVQGAIDELAGKDIALFDGTNFTDLSVSVPYNSSYTAPADGMYYIFFASTDNIYGAIIYADSARTHMIANVDANSSSLLTIALKAGATIYTRDNANTTYLVNGYIG